MYDFIRGVFSIKSLALPTLAWNTPHYHWRKTVSLLSSRWDQVVPICYVRQAETDVFTC